MDRICRRNLDAWLDLNREIDRAYCYEIYRFHQFGGVLMFGTDTGYLTDYNLSEEYRQLSLAGLNFRQILAMLTTAPAQEFGVAARTGRVAVGYDGDLTIVAADPATQPGAFTKVIYTIRSGRVICRQQ